MCQDIPIIPIYKLYYYKTLVCAYRLNGLTTIRHHTYSGAYYTYYTSRIVLSAVLLSNYHYFIIIMLVFFSFPWVRTKTLLGGSLCHIVYIIILYRSRLNKYSLLLHLRAVHCNNNKNIMQVSDRLSRRGGSLTA